MKMINLFLIPIFTILIGCAAALVPHTSDPSLKLDQYYSLMDSCRAHAAKDRLDEAFDILKRNNDEVGLAEVYFAYGMFYGAFARNPQGCMKIYIESYGDSALAKSTENLSKALEIYEKHSDYIGIAKCYYGLALPQCNSDEACNYFDKSLHAFEKAKKLDPSAKMPIRSWHKDWYDLLGDIKYKCCSKKYELLEEALQEYLGYEQINDLTITCNSPYELDQDCSFFRGSKRIIEIDGHKVRIAGSKDGKVVLMMDYKYVRNVAEPPRIPWAKDYHTEVLALGAWLIKNELNSKGVNTTRIIKNAGLGNVLSIVLELDKDGYSILKQYTKSE